MTETEPTAAAAEDFTAFMDRCKEQRAREEAVLPGNKAAILDALAAAGITRVAVNFDGYGDSGQIENIDAYRGESEFVALPETEVTIASASWGDPGIVAQTMMLEAAIEQMAYDLLSSAHGGWENNDGAHGEFRFDVRERVIALDYNERFTSSEFYSHEF